MVYRKGQQVICVETGGYPDITVGKSYTVVSQIDDMVYIIHDTGRQGGYYSSRLKPGEPVPRPKIPQTIAKGGVISHV